MHQQHINATYELAAELARVLTKTDWLSHEAAGDPHVSEYGTEVYPASVLNRRGAFLPWLEA